VITAIAALLEVLAAPVASALTEPAAAATADCAQLDQHPPMLWHLSPSQHWRSHQENAITPEIRQRSALATQQGGMSPLNQGEDVLHMLGQEAYPVRGQVPAALAC